MLCFSFVWPKFKCRRRALSFKSDAVNDGDRSLVWFTVDIWNGSGAQPAQTGEAAERSAGDKTSIEQCRITTPSTESNKSEQKRLKHRGHRRDSSNNGCHHDCYPCRHLDSGKFRLVIPWFLSNASTIPHSFHNRITHSDTCHVMTSKLNYAQWIFYWIDSDTSRRRVFVWCVRVFVANISHTLGTIKQFLSNFVFLFLPFHFAVDHNLLLTAGALFHGRHRQWDKVIKFYSSLTRKSYLFSHLF